MKNICPNKFCSSYLTSKSVVKDGLYFRKNDSKRIQRYVCTLCGKRFSKSTGELEYHQKKRRINGTLFKLLSSGNTIRRSALILNVDKKTVERRIPYLGKKSRIIQKKLRDELKSKPVGRVQFDDLITIEHTKLKPLSVSCAVDEETRLILGVEVSKIPSFGKLSKISKKKYGKNC